MRRPKFKPIGRLVKISGSALGICMTEERDSRVSKEEEAAVGKARGSENSGTCWGLLSCGKVQGIENESSNIGRCEEGGVEKSWL